MPILRITQSGKGHTAHNIAAQVPQVTDNRRMFTADKKTRTAMQTVMCIMLGLLAPAWAAHYLVVEVLGETHPLPDPLIMRLTRILIVTDQPFLTTVPVVS